MSNERTVLPPHELMKAIEEAAARYPESGMNKDGDKKSRAHQRAFVEGAEWAYKKLSPCMGWVKASERLPNRNGDYNARYSFNRCVADMRNGKFYEIRGLAHIISYYGINLEWLEWLDEPATSSPAQ